MPIITNSEIISRWTSYYGRKEVNSFQYLNKSGINTIIRINTLKSTKDKLVNTLDHKGIILEELPLDGALRVVKQRMSIGATNEFLLGYYAIQGLASQYVAHVVNPAESDKILDMSAAPGGKTAHLASLMNNKGLIVAVDTSKQRMTALRSNLSRLSVFNVLAIQGDATEIVKSFGLFDKVLLDAPCSGSGSICKRPEHEWKKNLSDISRLAEKQAKLLRMGLEHLKIGGELTFSTCSLEPEEGEEQIIRLLAKHGAAISIVPISNTSTFEAKELNYQSTHSKIQAENKHKWLRITPKEDYEGFFICKIRKESELSEKLERN